jgi:hypothetical protein
MAVIEVLLRVVSALHALDPAAVLSAPAAVPLIAVGLLGSAVAVAVVLAVRLVALVLGLGRPVRRPVDHPADLATRIAWSHPDAAGHVRSRAPGAVPAV